MADWEDTFARWAKGPGTTEKEKCDNAETAIRKAIAAHDKLNALDITILPQGSYRHKTNVRADSDVDFCVRLNTTFFPDYPKGKTHEAFGNIAGSIKYSDFRNLVQEALEAYFGASSITRGSKAFDIHANTYRVDADVVAAFEFRRYRYDDDGSFHYKSGVGFDTDTGKRIINWPEQNYQQGLKKHEDTNRRFRKVVRILKQLRNRMQDEKITAAADIASCLIEHLVFNVTDDQFGHDTLSKDLRAVLANVFNSTIKDTDCHSWIEVNWHEWLFRDTKQPWTRQKAHDFTSAAWDYLGFK
jgi:hypothetical protein